MAANTAPSERNATEVNDSSMTLDVPTFEESAAKPDGVERFVDQQWRDLEQRGDHQRHALAVNRDSPYVTHDPFD